jgi:hypothetical protein
MNFKSDELEQMPDGAERLSGRKKTRIEAAPSEAELVQKSEQAGKLASATAAATAAEGQPPRTHKYDLHKREHAQPKHPTDKEKRLLKCERITKTLYSDRPCCSKRCSRHFDFDAVLALRTLYVGLESENARTRHLIEQLVVSGNKAHAKAGQHSVFASVFGMDSCREGFRRAYGVSKDKLRRAVREWRLGHLLPPVHRGTAADHARIQSEFAEAALSRLFETLCDDVPSATGTVRIMSMWRSWDWVANWVAADWYMEHGLPVPDKLLADTRGNTNTSAASQTSTATSASSSSAPPSVTSRPQAGETAAAAHSTTASTATTPVVSTASSSTGKKVPGHRNERGRVLKSPSVSTVNRVRRAKFANVSRPRKGSLPACAVCVALMAERERCDPSQRANLNDQSRKHAQDHRRVRVLLQGEIDEWIADGDTMVVRSDYTTNIKIPHYRAPPQVSVWLRVRFIASPACCCLQNLNAKRPVVVKLCGFLIQGTRAHNGLFMIMHVHGVRKDADSVSTMLFEFLQWCREPQLKRLVFIVDNAGGEGKNTVVLSMLNLAAWYDYFAEVKMRNLFPGHAHSYLDSLFSHVQRSLRWRTLCSLYDVADAIAHSIRKEPLKPHLVVLERAVAWTEYVDASLQRIHGHSQPLQFNVFRDTRRQHAPAVMLCRTDYDNQWEGIDKSNEPIQLLRELPRGLPKLKALQPYAEDDIKAINETIAAAEKRTLPLIHVPEAEALRQIVSTGSSGVSMPSPLAVDGGIGVAGVLKQPGTSNSIAVRVLARVPRYLQAPARAPTLPSAHSSDKPPVPLFYHPRASAISHSAAKAKALRDADLAAKEGKDGKEESKGNSKDDQEQFQQNGSASASGGSGSGSALSSSASASAAPAHSKSRSRAKSPSPTRRSRRLSQSPSRSPRDDIMVGWEDIDDD